MTAKLGRPLSEISKQGPNTESPQTMGATINNESLITDISQSHLWGVLKMRFLHLNSVVVKTQTVFARLDAM